VAVTAKLAVRYRNPVDVDCSVEVIGSLESINFPLYFMTAEMRQRGRVMAEATATFFKTTSSGGLASTKRDRS
jgi:hypothetical protein